MSRGRARERLRQEREAFDQAKCQTAQWFWLRLAMGYVGMVLLVVIAIICGIILLGHKAYPQSAVTAAAAVLFVDLLGLLGSIFRLVLQQGEMTILRPVIGTEGEHAPPELP